jgi:hypothetical protein
VSTPTYACTSGGVRWVRFEMDTVHGRFAGQRGMVLEFMLCRNTFGLELDSGSDL